MRSLFFAIAALALAACAGPLRRETLAAGDLQGLERQLEAFVTRQMRDHQVEGASVALVDGGGTVLETGYGYADREAGKVADAHTRYCVGSVTKLFTATALMRLAEEGRIDIDRPLAAYLPEFSMRTRFPGALAPTLRSVMAHHSGIPTDRLAGMFGKNPGRYQDLPALLRNDYLAAPPWTIFAYSNVGYSLLGSVVERVAQRPYPDYVARTVLQPLAMTRSNFEPLAPEPAHAYNEGKRTWEPRLRDLPAGGLYASAHDMGRFLRMVMGSGELDGKRIVRPDTVAEMLRPQNTGVPLDFDVRIGLDWFHTPTDGGEFLFHGGSTINHFALAGIDTAKGVGVVVLAASRRGAEIMEPIAREALAMAYEARTGTPAASPTPGPAVPEARGADLADHAGAYATTAGLTQIEARADALRFKAAGIEGEARPLADGTFRLRLLVFGLFPLEPEELKGVRAGLVDVAGRHVIVASARQARTYVGERIAPRAIPDAWRARLGPYAIADMGDDYPLLKDFELAEEAGFLVLRIGTFRSSQVATLPLLAADDGEAVFAGAGRNLGETLRAERGLEGQELHYTGYRLVRRRM